MEIIVQEFKYDFENFVILGTNTGICSLIVGFKFQRCCFVKTCLVGNQKSLSENAEIRSTSKAQLLNRRHWHIEKDLCNHMIKLETLSYG